MATSLADIPPDIMHTHILHRLDAPSLYATTTASSYLHTLCSNDAHWAHISNSTWPSTAHPRLVDVISTFPSGHRSFFHDSFPSLSAHVNHCNRTPSSSHPIPSQFISAVDIRYQSDIIYSAVHVTDTSSGFLSSPLRIELNGSGSKQMPRISRPIDLEVDDIAGTDEAALQHLKESVTLTWVMIDPTRRRAGNLSSVKPVSARQEWMINDTVVKYVVGLPGFEPGEMVQCKIQVVLGASAREAMLHVKHVTLTLEDMNCRFLNGREFLVVTIRAILEENNVRRKLMVDGKERWRSHKEFKEMKRGKKKLVRMEEGNRELVVKMYHIFMLMSFCFSVYFLILLLQ